MQEFAEKLEKQRTHIVLIRFIGTLTILFSLWLRIDFSVSIYVTLFITTLATLGILYSLRLAKEFERDYKENLIKKILEQTLNKVTFEKDDKKYASAIKSSRIVDTGNHLSSYNAFRADFEGVGVIFSKVSCKIKNPEQELDQGKSTFIGNWISFDFGIPLKGEVQIHSRAPIKYEEIPELKKIPLKDASSKKYKIFATADEDAALFTKKSVLDDLTQYDAVRNDSLHLSVNQGKINIAIADEDDPFTPSICKSIQLDRITEMITKDIADIKDFITIVDLHKEKGSSSIEKTMDTTAKRQKSAQSKAEDKLETTKSKTSSKPSTSKAKVGDKPESTKSKAGNTPETTKSKTGNNPETSTKKTAKTAGSK